VIDEQAFLELRPQLFSLAYRMLGSASDAEDVVQDAWLRTRAAPPAVTSARAWMTTVVTRLCLDRLKSGRARREEYVGPWLPEPVPTDTVQSAEDLAARRESVTMAFLVLLETLTPSERAAFVLREAFDADYADIAQVLETTPAAARQLVHRAKERLASGRPRFVAQPERQREIVSRFFDAVRDGALDRLEECLASDVVFTADGGGKALAAQRPVFGGDAVARMFIGFWHKLRLSIDADESAWRFAFASVNGELALISYVRDRLDAVFVCSTDDRQITAIHAVRNPDKLVWLEAHLARDASAPAADSATAARFLR
jgi:RNA polymerase sigma-70 factor, ECF subfamily